MSKRIIGLALAVVSAALLALPPLASAETLHIDQITTFSVSGSGGTLTSTEGGSVTCTKTSGKGSFSTSTVGTASLVFTGCTGPFGFACTTGTEPSGTITAHNSFDLITVSSGKPGVLLTPASSNEPTAGKGKQFTEFSCLGISIKVFGTGSIGTLSTSVCSAASTTSTLTFASTATSGHQEDITYTGGTFDLLSTITAKHPTSSLDGNATLTYPGARIATCT